MLYGELRAGDSLIAVHGRRPPARAIKSYREVRRRRPDRTALVERERHRFIHRPALSKRYLARRDDRCPFLAENATSSSPPP